MDDGGRRSPHPFGARRLHPSRAPSPPAAPLIVAVVIPVFNERASLPLVVGDIPRALVREIVVVDNGSTDDTGLVARACRVRLVREPRRGYGSACLAGIAALEASPPDVVVFLDGDYSDHPEELPAAPRRDLRGRRPRDRLPDAGAAGARRAPSPGAVRQTLCACFLISVLFGHRYTDLGPFRAIRWEALRAARDGGPQLRLDRRDAGEGAPDSVSASRKCRSPTAGGWASRRSPERCPEPVRAGGKILVDDRAVRNQEELAASEFLQRLDDVGRRARRPSVGVREDVPARAVRDPLPPPRSRPRTRTRGRGSRAPSSARAR